MNKTMKLFFPFIIIVSLVIANCSLVIAQIPEIIHYQGKLSDDSGAPLTGSHTLTFKFYTVETGGTPIWTETQDVNLDSLGLYDALLGSVTSFESASADFSTSYWISVSVDGSPEMPRQKLGASPYSFHSKCADRISGSGSPCACESTLTVGSASRPGIIRVKTASGEVAITLTAADIAGPRIKSSAPTSSGLLNIARFEIYDTTPYDDASDKSSLKGYWNSATNPGNGIVGFTNSEGQAGVVGKAVPSVSSVAAIGVYGRCEANGELSSGVFGEASSTTGIVNGVMGATNSNEGTGVFGGATDSTGKNYGVKGRTLSNNVRAAGILGIAPNDGRSAAIEGQGNLRIYSSSELTAPLVFEVAADSQQVNIYEGGNLITAFGGPYHRAAIQTVNSTAKPTIPDNNFTIVGEAPITVTNDWHGVIIGCPDCCTEPCGAGGISCRCDSTLTVGSSSRAGVIKVKTATGEVAVTLTAADITGPKIKSSIPLTAELLSVGRLEAYEGTPYDDGGAKAAFKGYWNSATHPGNGIFGFTSSTFQSGILGKAIPSDIHSTAFGVMGITEANGDYSAGVFGEATSTSGSVNGVSGITNSNQGIGVEGLAESTSGVTFGVRGVTASIDTLAAGVIGIADSAGHSAALMGIGGLKIYDPSTAALSPVFKVLTGNDQVNMYESGELITTFGGSTRRVAIQKVNTSATPTIPDNNFSITGDAPIIVTTGTHGVTIGCPDCCTEPCGGGGGISCACESTLTVGSASRSGVIKVRTATGEVAVTLTALEEYGPKVKSSIPVSLGLNSVGRIETYEGAAYDDGGYKAAFKGYWNSSTYLGDGIFGFTKSNARAGVFGKAVSSGEYSISYGVKGIIEADGEGSSGVYGEAISETGIVRGVYGITNSAGDFACGVLGKSDHTSGETFGVIGETKSETSQSAGVYGKAGFVTIGVATGMVYGVRGESYSATPYSAGVFGSAGFGGGSGRVYGVIGTITTDADSAAGVLAAAPFGSGLAFGVHSKVSSNRDGAAGILAESKSTAGKTYGVCGKTFSSTAGAAGVSGMTESDSGFVSGVEGMTSSKNGTGVSGIVFSTSGTNYGVEGLTYSSDSSAAAVFGRVSVPQAAAFLGNGDLRIYNSTGFTPVFKVLTELEQINMYQGGDLITAFGGPTRRVAIQKVNTTATPTIPDNNFTVAGDAPITVTTGAHGVTIGCPDCCTEPCGGGGGGCACGSTFTVGTESTPGAVKVVNSHGNDGLTITNDAAYPYACELKVGGNLSKGSIEIWDPTETMATINLAIDGSYFSCPWTGFNDIIVEGDAEVQGDLEVLGAKDFRVPHPEIENMDIRFACTESPEVMIEYCGVLELDSGYGEAELPHEFQLMSEPGTYRIICTPMGSEDPGRISAEVTEDGTVKIYSFDGPESLKVTYNIKATRVGYKDRPVVVESRKHASLNTQVRAQ
ncbi:hypothetical protein JXI42_02960 [bacterium]|nr:hypothetical protein [bacterium]